MTERPEPGTVAGIVLAAGASRRMGRPKPLLEIKGRTYLERVVDCLAGAGVTPIRVVVGCGAERIAAATPSPAAAVHCDDWEAGMLVSLQAGIRALRDGRPPPSAALVALCDMPRIRVDSVRALLEGFASRRPPVAVPIHGDRRGHPVIFARAVWREILEAPRDATPRHVVERHRGAILQVRVDDPWILRDADTPQAHRRMESGD